jgi:hypothetical protein
MLFRRRIDFENARVVRAGIISSCQGDEKQINGKVVNLGFGSTPARLGVLTV